MFLLIEARSYVFVFMQTVNFKPFELAISNFALT